jgi:uncharacterized damage-inducible protein DinB
MLTASAARTLADYKKWANHETFLIVEAVPEEEIYKTRPTLFKNIAATLNHTYVVDMIWQAHIEGRKHGIPALNTVTHPRLADLHAAQLELDGWYADWAATQTDDSLSAERQFELIGGNAGQMSCAEMLLHVVTHNAYHRGFVADMLTAIGAKRPSVDYPIYKRHLLAA